MKYCAHCGWELQNEAKICTHCGCTPDSEPVNNSKQNRNDTLAIIARFFMLLSLATCIVVAFLVGIGALVTAIVGIWVEAEGLHLATKILLVILGCSLLPLCWITPLTIICGHRLGAKKTIGTGMKICVLLFVSIAAGILMLCMSDEQEFKSNGQSTIERVNKI